MFAKPLSHYLAPGLLVLSTLLAAANWYLAPERAPGWFMSVLVLAGLTAVLLLVVWRPSGEPDPTPAERKTADSLRSGVAWAGMMIVVSLAGKLAVSLGAALDANFAQRALMAVIGAFLVFTGNALPKTLSPLISMTCDPARMQAFQRFAGWTWVLTGLVLSLSWLALPIRLAEPGTFLLLPFAILLIAVQLVRLRRTHQRPA